VVWPYHPLFGERIKVERQASTMEGMSAWQYVLKDGSRSLIRQDWTVWEGCPPPRVPLNAPAEAVIALLELATCVERMQRRGSKSDGHQSVERRP
jgi:hypothetical protein